MNALRVRASQGQWKSEWRGTSNATLDLIPRFRLDAARVCAVDLFLRRVGDLQQHLRHQVRRHFRYSAVPQAGVLDRGRRGADVSGQHDQLPGASRELSLALYSLNSVPGDGCDSGQEVSRSAALDSASWRTAFPAF